ncbi:MAG: hypothetical protein JXR95_07540 [Deltaproteobacteria bacterium]|nr:hypothetical protein [Deltaproteobacteria bacterium]
MYLLILHLLVNSQFSIDPLGQMVAQNFMDQLANKDHKKAALLCNTTVNFDGQIISGQQNIEKHFETVFKAHKAPIVFKKFIFLKGDEILKKLGKLPERLGTIDFGKTILILGRRKTGGIAVFLQEENNISGRYRVIAITD